MLIQDPLLPVRINLAEIDRMLEQLDEIVDKVGVGLVSAFSAFTIDYQELSNSNRHYRMNSVQCDHLVRQNDAIILTHGLSAYVDPALAELMHNYIHVVADLLQPAHHRHNPYRSLYVPKAVGAAAASLFVGATGTASQAGTALFHALLAVSASHLHRQQPDQPRYGRQGRMHRIKAIEHLQICLAEPEKGKENHTMMSAMLSMVSIDVSSSPLTSKSQDPDACTDDVSSWRVA